MDLYYNVVYLHIVYIVLFVTLLAFYYKCVCSLDDLMVYNETMTFYINGHIIKLPEH